MNDQFAPEVEETDDMKVDDPWKDDWTPPRPSARKITSNNPWRTRGKTEAASSSAQAPTRSSENDEDDDGDIDDAGSNKIAQANLQRPGSSRFRGTYDGVLATPSPSPERWMPTPSSPVEQHTPTSIGNISVGEETEVVSDDDESQLTLIDGADAEDQA